MKEKIKLKVNDFELIGAGTSYWYFYSGTYPGKRYAENWPFHRTAIERAEFIQRLGINDNSGMFPYMKTPEEALFVLVVAITEHNDKL